MESRSLELWRRDVASTPGISPHIRAQREPVSSGARLLEAGLLGSLYEAAECDRLRLGMGTLSIAVPGGRARRCALCAADDYGLAHLLARCVTCHKDREAYLSKVDAEWSQMLRHTLEGDWPACVMSPSQSLQRLTQSVRFCAAVYKLIQDA
jgi:hypothetical protein